MRGRERRETKKVTKKVSFVLQTKWQGCGRHVGNACPSMDQTNSHFCFWYFPQHLHLLNEFGVSGLSVVCMPVINWTPPPLRHTQFMPTTFHWNSYCVSGFKHKIPDGHLTLGEAPCSRASLSLVWNASLSDSRICAHTSGNRCELNSLWHLITRFVLSLFHKKALIKTKPSLRRKHWKAFN